MTGKVDFTGVQSTMLVTLYLRALDSREQDSILGDHAAAEAVGRIDYDWAKLAQPGMASNRFLVALRAKQFDDWAADFLRRNPDATVLQLGCGLDSRAFRLDLPSGVRWFDVDLPDVIELRRELYPESEGYRTIGASVTDPAWLAEIPADQPVLIIAEGLLMYLPTSEVEALLRRLTDHFRTGELIFDGVALWVVRMTQWCARRLPKRIYDYPGYLTATQEGRDVERWNPKFRFLAAVPIFSLHAKVPNPTFRALYRAANRWRAVRYWLRVFRAEF
ncbi:class I SAM-dependent methyltransferase [Saccharopolyspora sp. K220]|uniref:class I SAM-dependent methyltransferase n=1 Tax=Saccharopolyspora soli TaxID=2926618 RepID=UPI001F590626|nr:class I SAM-dependent methyltransferase [Saccharopolyspora soli]MCI2422455.1 class I SAM-dependent methyltransferase [Saccharopolyspora soli]